MVQINAAARLTAVQATRASVLSEIKTASKEAGIKLPSTGFYEAKSDAQDESVDAFLEKLTHLGFTRSKSKAGGEYDFIYSKGDVEVHTSLRYGKGYGAILGIK